MVGVVVVVDGVAGGGVVAVVDGDAEAGGWEVVGDGVRRPAVGGAVAELFAEGGAGEALEEASRGLPGGDPLGAAGPLGAPVVAFLGTVPLGAAGPLGAPVVAFLGTVPLAAAAPLGAAVAVFLGTVPLGAAGPLGAAVVALPGTDPFEPQPPISSTLSSNAGSRPAPRPPPRVRYLLGPAAKVLPGRGRRWRTGWYRLQVTCTVSPFAVGRPVSGAGRQPLPDPGSASQARGAGAAPVG